MLTKPLQPFLRFWLLKSCLEISAQIIRVPTLLEILAVDEARVWISWAERRGFNPS